MSVKKRQKALSVSPLKTSQTIGATLAFLGVKGAVPLMHGSQGCTAFAKVFFVSTERAGGFPSINELQFARQD